MDDRDGLCITTTTTCGAGDCGECPACVDCDSELRPGPEPPLLQGIDAGLEPELYQQQLAAALAGADTRTLREKIADARRDYGLDEE